MAQPRFTGRTSRSPFAARNLCEMAIALLLLSTGGLGQSTPKAIAEGDYGVRGAPRTNTLPTHWVMTELSDGNLEVEIPRSTPASVGQQRFRFTPDFKPIGYAMDSKSSLGGSSSFNCAMPPSEMKCDSEFEGVKGTVKLKVDKPYVFIDWGMDIVWFNASIMSQVARVPGQVTEVADVTFGEDDLENKNKPTLVIDEVLKIKYVGRENFNSVFGWIECDVFEDVSHPSSHEKVMVAPSGVVVAMVSSEKDARTVELLGLQGDQDRVLRH